MRRPFIKALVKASLGTALAASTVSAQQALPSPADGAGVSPPAAAPVNPARGARHLLRNGWDYVNYQEYERALAFFREAQTRQVELTEAERVKLKQGIERAQRGVRESASGIDSGPAYARGGRSARPGSIAMAPAQAPRRDAIQLAGGASNPGENPNAANVRASGAPAAGVGAPVNTPAAAPPSPDVESISLPPMTTAGPPAAFEPPAQAPAPALPDRIAAAPSPAPAASAPSPTPDPAEPLPEPALPLLPTDPTPAAPVSAPAPIPSSAPVPDAVPTPAPEPVPTPAAQPGPEVESLPALPRELSEAPAAAPTPEAASPSPAPALPGIPGADSPPVPVPAGDPAPAPTGAPATAPPIEPPPAPAADGFIPIRGETGPSTLSRELQLEVIANWVLKR